MDFEGGGCVLVVKHRPFSQVNRFSPCSISHLNLPRIRDHGRLCGEMISFKYVIYPESVWNSYIYNLLSLMMSGNGKKDSPIGVTGFHRRISLTMADT